MKDLCLFCKSAKIKTHWFYKKLHICESCHLGFNAIESPFKYDEITDFVFSDRKMDVWRKFATRDLSLLNLDFDNKTVLEIGCGYGFLGCELESKYSNVNYIYNEANVQLKSYLRDNHKNVIDNCFDYNEKVDYIVLNHVLEHISDAPIFLTDILKKFQNASIIMFQTNFNGFIPKYLPFLWYGYSFDQHYYHFTPETFSIFFQKYGLKVQSLKYYKLDQLFSFSLKGLVKIFLKIINIFVRENQSDAFVVMVSSNL